MVRLYIYINFEILCNLRYQQAVRSLEDSLKKLGKYGYIENPTELAELEEPLLK